MARRIPVVASLLFLLLVLPGCPALYPLLRVAAHEYEGEPIPTGPDAYTQKDYSQLALQFNTRTMVEAYKQVGKKDPSWDEAAIRFLESYARRFSETADAPEEKALLKQAEGLMASGCDDPLVMYCCGVAFQVAGRMEEAVKLLRRAMDGLAESGYPRIRAAFAAMRLAVIYEEEGYGKPGEADECWDRAIEWLGETAQQAIYRKDEERVFLEALLERWDDIPLAKIRAISKTMARFAASYPYLTAVVEGELEVDEAWEDRGDDWAEKVTPEGWKGFEEHLEKARSVLTKAWELHPEYPEAPASMIRVAMAGHGGRGETGRMWFDRAVAAQMDYENAYDTLLHFMRPRWGGSHEEMYEWGVECLETGRFDTEAPLWFVHSLEWITDDREGDKSYWTRPETREHLQALFAGYRKAAPASKRAWFGSLEAATWWYLGEYRRARELLDEVGAGLEESVFQEYFDASAADAKGETYLLSGPHAAEAQRAERCYEKEDFAGALAGYEEILRAETGDPASSAFVRKRTAFLRVKQKLAAGEWADIRPDAEFTGWIRDKGKWELEKDGAIRGTSTGSGLWLLYDEDVGSRIEFRGSVELVAAPEEHTPNCGVIFNCTGVASWDYFAMLVSEPKQQVMLSYNFEPSDTTYTKAEVQRENTFLIRLWDDTVTTYLNGKLVNEEVQFDNEEAWGRAAVGMGSKCQHSGVVARFWGLQVRRLAKKPSGKAVPTEEPRDGRERS